MIINNNNKNEILKGKIKRGFNQKPSDIVDRIEKMKEKKEVKTANNLNKALINIKRLNK